MFQYRQKVAIAYICAYFLDLMNSYMATVAFPSMGKELHASASQLSWVVTAYILSLTLIIPVSGWLGDRFGTKKVFVSSLFIFTVASFLCGLSNSIEMLIFWRFVQGLGGGLLIPVGQAMLYRQYLPVERARISATVLIPATIAPMIAPTVGGFLVEHFPWKSVFYFNVPLGLVIFLCAVIWLREEKSKTHVRISFLTLALLSFGLFFLLYACYLFSTPRGVEYGLMAFVLSILTLGVFLFISARINNPILELKLLGNKTFRTGAFIYFFLTMSFSAVNILMIYFFQNVLGASPAQTGSLMIPFGIGSIVGLKTTVFIFNKIGPKPIINIFLSVFMLSAFLFCFIDNISQFKLVCFIFLIYGVSVGFLVNSVQNMSYMHISNYKMGNASAIFNLNRQLGLSLGVATFTMILTLFLHKNQLLNGENTLHNLVAISIFHICFFMANIINILSFLALWKLDKKETQLAS